MKKYPQAYRLFTCIFLLALPLFLSAQQTATANRITLGTFHLLEAGSDNTAYNVLIRGDVIQVRTWLSQNRAALRYVSGDMLSATLNKAQILALNREPFVVRIDCPQQKIIPLNDVMVLQNNIDSAYYGYAPLMQGYDGTHVVVGIIDEPFDIQHGDFKDADGHTRIKFLWDQNLASGGSDPGYGYGIECDSISVENGTCPSSDDDALHYSHGSGVTGVAASSGEAAHRYRGVAPNADLVLVSLKFDTDLDEHLLDAIHYIFQKADSLQEPCVINTSLGSYTGSHDGKDMTAQMIDNEISAENGRVLVAAAGNAGNIAFHLGYHVTDSTHFTWFKKLGYANAVYFQVWADSSDFANVSFSLAADNPSGYVPEGTTPDYSLADYDLEDGAIDSTEYNIPGAGNVKTYAQILDGTCLLEVYVVPADPTFYWRFSTHGDGQFDIWSGENVTGYSNFVTSIPDAVTFPDITHYVLPNTDETIVSSWQCSEKVITVGSYVNRDTMTNFYNEEPLLVDTPGTLFYSSSLGPTRTGMIKPDICATGARIISTEASVLSDWLISLGAANYMSPDGMHYMYNGTSFSSPVVAGIAALYLQKNPEAGWAEVKDALLGNARKDAFTGDMLPDNRWGYGKADAFRMLTGPWGCSADDYSIPPTGLHLLAVSPVKAQLAWDAIPNADAYQIMLRNPSTGAVLRKNAVAAVRIVPGLTPGSTYVCRVRALCADLGKSAWSDTIQFVTPVLRDAAPDLTLLSVFPNPAAGTLHISGLASSCTCSISTLTGQVLFSTRLDPGDNKLSLSALPVGMYLLVMQSNSEITVQKLIIAR